MTTPGETITGLVRSPRNRAAHVSGSIHDSSPRYADAKLPG